MGKLTLIVKELYLLLFPKPTGAHCWCEGEIMHFYILTDGWLFIIELVWEYYLC